MPTQSRQLAAIMFTDIVGYTALMGKDSNKALDLVRISKEIQKPLVEKHNGKWLKEMGDGAMAQFSTALDAVNCAIEIQEMARAKFDGKLRIGIHSGDITIENNDVYGDGVNVAARLESIADPGGIYISESIEKAIRGQSDIQAKYLGEAILKNVDYGVRTYAIQGVGLPVPDLNKDKGISGRFFAELERRSVIRPGIMYLLISALMVLLLPIASAWISIPESFKTILLAVLGIGFPIAVYLAWRYERSPDGFVRSTSDKSWQNPLKSSQRKPLTGNVSIAGITIIIVFIYLLYPRFSISDQDQKLSNNEKSIAFLPLENISDEENNYLSSGVKSEIARSLRNIPNLKVYAGLDVDQLLTKNMSKKEIGDELGVSIILEGTIWKEQNRFKLNMFLTDVNSDEVLWEETIDKEYELLMDVVSEVANNLTKSLQIVLTPQERNQISATPTTSPEAYDLNLKAWQTRSDAYNFRANKRDSVYDISRSLAMKALEYDSNYISPLELIAALDVDFGNFEDAKIIADKLMDKYPNEPTGYKLNAGIHFSFGEYDKSFELYQLAFDRDAKDPWINLQLGRIYCFIKNDYLNGLPYMTNAAELPPLPGTMPLFGWLPHVYMCIGDYEKAMYWSRRDLKYFSNCGKLNDVFDNYTAQGKYDQFINFLDSICPILACDNCDRFYFRTHIFSGDFEQAATFTKIDSSEFYTRYLTEYYKIKTGNIEEGEKLLNDRISRIENYMNREVRGIQLIDVHFSLARIYSLLGEKKKAIDNLNYCEERGFWYGSHDLMMSSPEFDGLKSDPEFLAIYERVQKEKAAIRAQVQEMEEKRELDF